MMRESPRIRRLRSDFRAMQQLAAESGILDFSYRLANTHEPPEAYLLRFRGAGLARDENTGRVRRHELHEVSVELGASYPRMMPEVVWRSPVFHPNISASGMVCLGGYSTHWVPSLNLAELCRMLWDMIRFVNFDIESPYNREAALWVRKQVDFRLPLDERPLRDKFVPPSPIRVDGGDPLKTLGGALPESPREREVVFPDACHPRRQMARASGRSPLPSDPDIVFIE